MIPMNKKSERLNNSRMFLKIIKKKTSFLKNTRKNTVDNPNLECKEKI